MCVSPRSSSSASHPCPPVGPSPTRGLRTPRPAGGLSCRSHIRSSSATGWGLRAPPSRPMRSCHAWTIRAVRTWRSDRYEDRG
nr:MAG TPA: hypothetical protein [Caudoviricetes sp.]